MNQKRTSTTFKLRLTDNFLPLPLLSTTQWRTMGFWRPGQGVESLPLFLIFFPQKNSKVVDPKQILVIFKSEKKILHFPQSLKGLHGFMLRYTAHEPTSS